MSPKPPYWTTVKFKKLSKQWDEKLKNKGFVDAEKDTASGRALITSSYPLRNKGKGFEASKEDYYRLMGQAVYNNEAFDSALDRLILLRHVEGVMIKDICKELQARGQSRDRGTVSNIIKRYEKKWKVVR